MGKKKMPDPKNKGKTHRRTTIKQNIFVNEYFANGFNGSKAAIAAGYAKNSAGVTASKLLKTAKVQAAIKEKAAEITGRCDVKIARIIRKLEDIAFADIADFISFNNGDFFLKHEDDMGDTSVLDSVSKFETEKMTQTKIKLADRMKAIELLGKYYAMFTDKIEHSGDMVTETKVIIEK